MAYKIKNEPDGLNIGGWYGGKNKKYRDMFNLTSEENAYIFEEEKEAKEKAEFLNMVGYNFVVVKI